MLTSENPPPSRGMGVSPMLPSENPPPSRGMGVSPMLTSENPPPSLAWASRPCLPARIPHPPWHGRLAHAYQRESPTLPCMGVSPMVTSENPPPSRGMGVSPMVPSGNPPPLRFAPDNLPQVVRAKQGANLPHWTLDGAAYAVTFRLADALPQETLNEWIAKRNETVLRAAAMDRPLTDMELARLSELHDRRIQSYLDSGVGSCRLREEPIARMVIGALEHFDEQRYHLLAWCLMPNHLHVIVRPAEGYTLASILHSWKSYTAHRANQMLGQNGSFWQAESYDHLIRDEEDLSHQVQYIWRKPG